MKKIFLLLVTAVAVTFTSCNNDDDRPVVDNDTIGETFEIGPVNFTPDPGDPSSNVWSITTVLDPAIFDSDVVLVYRQAGLSGGQPIWRLIPQTVYLGGTDELEYTSDFTVNDLVISMNSNIDLFSVPEYTQNQRFRIVIVPSDFSATVDTGDYNAVMKALDHTEGDVQMIDIK